jgi:hypothetical protein
LISWTETPIADVDALWMELTFEHIAKKDIKYQSRRSLPGSL